MVEVVIASSFAALVFRGRLRRDGVGINRGAAAAAMTTVALLSGRRCLLAAGKT